MKPAGLLLANLGVTCAAILIYHVATSRGAAPVSDTPAAPATHAAPSSPGLAPIGVAPSFERFEALERRMATLEKALSTAATLAPGAPPPSSAGGTGAGGRVATPSFPVWTEEQLAALRAMNEELEVRKRQDAYAATMRGVIRHAAKEPVGEERETRAIALLLAFQRKVAEIFPEGSGGANLEERTKSMGLAQRARDAMEEELRRVLPPDVADRILSMVPRYPALPDPDLPSPPMGDGR